MNKGVTAVLSFAVGGGLGAAAMWIFEEKRWKKLFNMSVEKIRKEFEEREPKSETKEEEPKEEVQETKPEETAVGGPVLEKEPEIVTIKSDPNSLKNDFQKQAAKIAREKPDIINYNKMIKELKYTPPTNEEDDEYSEYPYLITDEFIPFGEKYDADGNPYTKTTLIYYDDGVVADTAFEVIDNVNDVIGNDSLTHFGEFSSKDSVFVRNDRLHTDFEVCMSALSWEGDILERMPYLRGV